MNKIRFHTTLDNEGKGIAYDISGSVTTDNEQAELGFSSFSFNRAFRELCYWAKECPNAEITYTTSTI